jgi:hypothetical protein
MQQWESLANLIISSEFSRQFLKIFQWIPARFLHYGFRPAPTAKNGPDKRSNNDTQQVFLFLWVFFALLDPDQESLT